MDVSEIGARMRELREVTGETTRSMSGALGISAEQYDAYEGGAADIPISVLLKSAELLHVEPSVLLTGDAPRLRVYTLTRAGKGVSIARREHYMYQSLAYNFGHKMAEPFLVTVEGAAEDTPVSQNAHPGQEFDYCLNGTLKVVIGDAELLLEPGDCVYFDSSYPHGMLAIGGHAQFLAVVMKV